MSDPWKKLPQQRESATTTKQPKTDSSLKPSQQTPHWCFSIFDPKDWRDPTKAEAEEIFRDVAVRLSEIGKRTWGEIESNSWRDHSVAVYKMIPEAQKRLQELSQDDVDSLWRLRSDGLQRVWGIREGRLLKILWWDPHHKICPSYKPHT